MQINTTRGIALDARIDVADEGITLHSRSGSGASARNPDYKHAFLTIVSRLSEFGLRPDIFLDSTPAQRMALIDRQVWQSGEYLPPQEMFAEVVRRMNAFPGSRSRGAW